MALHDDAIFKKYPVALRAIGDIDRLEFALNQFDRNQGYAQMPGRIARVIDECVGGTQEFREALIICAYYSFDKESTEGNIAYFDREYGPLTERIAYDMMRSAEMNKDMSPFLALIMASVTVSMVEMQGETFAHSPPFMTKKEFDDSKAKMDNATRLLMPHIDERALVDRYNQSLKIHYEMLEKKIKPETPGASPLVSKPGGGRKPGVRPCK